MLHRSGSAACRAEHTVPGRRDVLKVGAAMRLLLLALVLGACGANSPGVAPRVGVESAAGPLPAQRNAMKINLKLENRTLTATLTDSPTARDLMSLLPLTLTMKDLFGREKYGRLPRALSDGGERRYRYEVGQLIYWSPGPDVAIYYRQDGERIPEPGIIVLGTIDAGIDALEVRDAVKLQIERATDGEDQEETPGR